MPCLHHWVLDTQTLHIHSIIMSNSFINGLNINSTCVDYINVNALRGTAFVRFTDGSDYMYTNVSRRAILKFILDDARSLGKFVNVVLKQQRVACI